MADLKVIPYYTGFKDLKKALKDRKSLGILWLEILFNDVIAWQDYLGIKEVKKAYEKACLWYTNFKTLIESHIKRAPLEIKKGKVDNRQYRRFLEVLNFVSTQS